MASSSRATRGSTSMTASALLFTLGKDQDPHRPRAGLRASPVAGAVDRELPLGGALHGCSRDALVESGTWPRRSSCPTAVAITAWCASVRRVGDATDACQREAAGCLPSSAVLPKEMVIAAGRSAGVRTS